MKKATIGLLLFGVIVRLLWGMVFGAPVVDSFAAKAFQADLKKGFLEISPDWDAFVKEWGDSSGKARRQAAAVSIVDYASFAELATVYRVRAQLYAQVAADSKLNRLCDGTISNGAAAELVDQLGPLVGIVGHTLGRMYLEQARWKPPVNLRSEMSWIQLATYLNRIGKRDILEGLQELANGRGVSRQRQCEVLGALYSLAGNRPADTMGSVSIMDFVRSIESLVAHEGN